MAVAAPRRGADRDEHGFRILDPARQVGGKGQPAALRIGLDQSLEPRLPDRHQPRVEAVDLARILVDAADLVAEIGKARARDEPHIAGADHRDAHAVSIPCPRAGGS